MQCNDHKYFMLYKPFNMVSQFIGNDGLRQLHEIDYDFPEGIHAIGRLDSHSEGLLLLTTNKKITKLLFESKTPHRRTYIVQVLNVMTEEKAEQLRNGIAIKIKGNVDWTTSPCEVDIIEKPTNLFPVENGLKEFIPHSWLRITLTEGKYHQIRKMVFAMRHRCRRLIRISIEDMHINDLAPGMVKEVNEADFFRLLKI
ncbi:MAG: rRNA pseudouridine synthase [Bacteroidetes bacterium]|nr:rRNA pseudouridine synthase [Bacteroidota bacterium]